MQKKIIALAVAAAFTVPAVSYAAAEVYGIAHLSVDVVNNGAQNVASPATIKSSSANQLNSNRSRVGLKGSEDLGGGLTAMWQAEGTVGFDAGGFTLDRNTFIGVNSADMGTLILGRHDTPYKIATRKLDVFKDTQADNRDGGTLAGHDLRLNNVIAYVSPDISGLTVAVASTFDAENPTTSTVADADKKSTVLSLAGMYTRDNIYATLAYQSVKVGSLSTMDTSCASSTLGDQSNLINASTCAAKLGLNGNIDDETKSLKLGGGYTMDAFTVNAFVEQVTTTLAAAAAGGATTVVTNLVSDEKKGTNMYLGAKFAVSNTDAVKLAYSQRGEITTTQAGSADVKKKKASQISLGYDHNMSKATTVYALYSKVTDDAETLTGTTVTAKAADPSVISFGIKHSF